MPEPMQNIGLVWQQVQVKAENGDLERLLAKSKGVDAIAPTWLFLKDGEGNFDSSASVDYVNAATGHYMSTHRHAIPLTIMQTATGNHAYSVANLEEDCERECAPIHTDLTVQLNPNYQIKPRNVVIIGHNSKCRSIMDGFNAFRGEHKTADSEILKSPSSTIPKTWSGSGIIGSIPM